MVELKELRIQRLELEQRDADRETLEAIDAAILRREQQLDKALYHKWWEKPPPAPCKRECGHVYGSVLRECCKACASGGPEALRWAERCRFAHIGASFQLRLMRERREAAARALQA
jgi:hypothetical protein